MISLIFEESGGWRCEGSSDDFDGMKGVAASGIEDLMTARGASGDGLGLRLGTQGGQKSLLRDFHREIVLIRVEAKAAGHAAAAGVDELEALADEALQAGGGIIKPPYRLLMAVAVE